MPKKCISIILILSLIISATPPVSPALPVLHPTLPCFSQQALAVPALSGIHPMAADWKQAKSLMLKAATQLRKGHLDQARGFYDAVLALNPLHPLAHLRRGSVYHAQGELARAKKDVIRALELKLRPADGRAARVLLQDIEAKLQQQPVLRTAAMRTWAPAALAFTIALLTSSFSMGQLGVSLVPQVSPTARIEFPGAPTQTPPQQTYTNTLFVTPGPLYRQLTLPETADVKPLLRAKETFQADQPVVEITRDHALYEEEENKALAEVREFEILDERINQEFKAGLISEQQKQEHDTGFAVAQEKLARARDGHVTQLSFPYSGTVEQVENGKKIAKGTPYLKVTDAREQVITLPNPDVKAADRSTQKLIWLVQNGFEFTVSKDGKRLPHSNVRTEGETFSFSVPSDRWQGGPGQIQVSVQAPPALSAEPSYAVRHRTTYDVPAPEDGIVKSVPVLPPGKRLPAGAHAFIQYDSAGAKSERLALLAYRAYWRDATERARRLISLDSPVGAPVVYEQHKNKLDLAEKEVARVEAHIAVLENPATPVSEDFIVIQQFPFANGQRIKEGTPLVKLGLADQFEATLLIDLASAQALNIGDGIPLILAGKHARFSGVIRSKQSAGQKMEVTVDIEGQGVLSAGLRVQIDHASPKDQPSAVPAHWVVEKIRRSTDYDWARSTLDGVFQDSTFSEEERAQIFNDVVEDPHVRDLYKEWALIKLVDMGKVDDLFRFVQQHQPDGSSRLFSFAFRLLHTQLFEVSLYSLPSLDKETAKIDQFVASLMERDAAVYGPAVKFQLLLAKNPYAVISRWLKNHDLFPIATEANYSWRGLRYLEGVDASLMDPDSNWDRLSMLFKTDDPDFRRDHLAILAYLKTGNVDLQTLEAMAPALTAVVHPATPPPGKGKTDPNLPALELLSNTAAYFESSGADPRVAAREMQSGGAKLVSYELAATYQTVALQAAQELIHQKDLLGLIHLFNHLPPAQQKIVLAEKAVPGLLSNTVLAGETLEGNTASDQVGKNLFQNFYGAALSRVTDAGVRRLLTHALIKTYSEIELVKAVYGTEGASDYHDEAKRTLQVQVARDLLEERAAVLKKRAEGTLWPNDPQETQVAQAETAYAADAISKSDDVTPDLLAQSGVSMQDVDQRMQHYEDVFTHSDKKLWVAPKELNERTAPLILVVVALLGWKLWPKRFSKVLSVPTKPDSLTADLPASSGGGDVLSLFAQTGKDPARMHREYRENRVSFLKAIWVRTLTISVTLTGLISFMELNKASHWALVFLSLVVIDQVFNVALIQKRQIFEKTLGHFFPALLKYEVVKMRFSRDVPQEAADVFNDPMRTAMRFTSGELFWLYALDGLLSSLANGIGLAFIHIGLLVVYLVLIALFVALIARISSETSEINRLAEEKERVYIQWMRDTERRVRMGFSADSTPVTYGDVSKAIDKLNAEKMKYVTWVRMLMVLIPGASAIVKIPASGFAIFRGLEGISFFPDWAPERPQWKRAEKSIKAFVGTLLKRPPVDASLIGLSVDRLELRDLSLGLRDGRQVIRKINMDLEVGSVHLVSGLNHSGKTTLLRYLSGNEPNLTASGTAVYHGQLPSGEAVVADARKATAFAHYLIDEPLVSLGPVREMMNSLKSEAQKDLFKLLIDTHLIGLDMDEEQVNALTPGQKARLQLAYVLAGTPASVIMMDEVLDAHMDEEAERRWLRGLKDYAVHHQKIILLAEKRDINNRDILDGRFELSEGQLYSESKVGVEVHDVMDVIRMGWSHMGVGLGLGLLGRAVFSDEMGLYLAIGATLISWIVKHVEELRMITRPARAIEASA